MIKTLSNLTKQDKEKFKVPKKIQQIIPIDTIYNDGIFQVGKNKFSITYKFTDINYAVASREDKEAMFLEYSELLNSFDSGATTKITISLRRLNKENFEKEILLPLMNDELDQYGEEPHHRPPANILRRQSLDNHPKKEDQHRIEHPSFGRSQTYHRKVQGTGSGRSRFPRSE